MTLPSAAALAAQQLGAQRTGIALGIFPADTFSSIEIQRAPDSGGAPDVGSAATIAIAAPGTAVFVDALPLDGARRHYRVRATGLRGSDSDWTGWVDAVPGVLPATPVRPDALEPIITPTTLGSQTDVTVGIDVNDPQRRVTLVEFRTKIGTGAWSAWAPDAAPYEAVATLTGAGDEGSRIGWRVTGYNRLGQLGVLREGESLWPINRGVAPVVTKLTRARFNAATGKYEIWMRFYRERGNDQLLEDPTLGFVTIFGAANIKDQAGASATGYAQHSPKESDGWRCSWDSTSGQQWTFDVIAYGLQEVVEFPGGDLDDLTIPAPLVRGTHTVVAPPAASGMVAGIPLVFSSTTSAADPGAGVLRFNHATLASVTAIYVDDLDRLGMDIRGLLATFDDTSSTVKGYLLVRSNVPGAAGFAVFTLSSLTQPSGYTSLVVAHVAGGTGFTDGEQIAVEFWRTGDRGPGVPAGGTEGQVLTIVSGVPAWTDPF